MAETQLANGPAQRNGGARYQLVVHVDPAALSEDAPDARCALEDGPAIPAETARRLACDASLVALTEQNGRPLSVGRKTRAIPPALRRALQSRDHGCCFPGCNQRRFVDAHHIEHWAHGGETKLVEPAPPLPSPPPSRPRGRLPRRAPAGRGRDLQAPRRSRDPRGSAEPRRQLARVVTQAPTRRAGNDPRDRSGPLGGRSARLRHGGGRPAESRWPARFPMPEVDGRERSTGVPAKSGPAGVGDRR